MKQFLEKSQKIKVTCIIRSNTKVLLLRTGQLANPEHQPQGGYFDLPSFTVSFGEDPEEMLQKAMEEYFNQPVDGLTVLDVRHYMSHDQTTQVFEVVYTGTSAHDTQTSGRYGKFLFVEVHELDAYMFPSEREYLERYLL